MPSFAIVANAQAGGRRANATAQAVHDLLKQHDAPVRLYRTSSHTDLQALVKLALNEHAAGDQHSPCIVACGGDGSIQEIVNTVMSESAREAVVGLAPAGTCNDFAFALGVKPDPAQIVDTLLRGQVRAIDLGLAGNRYFCTIATVGLESTVNRYLKKLATSSPSRWMFVAAAVSAVVTQRSIRARLLIDDDPVDLKMVSLIVANTPCYGGQIRIAPVADPCDGMFQVGLFAAMSRLQRLFLLRAALAGRHAQRRGVTFREAASLKVSTDHPTEVWADGELIGSTPIDIRIIPAAIKMMLPSESKVC